MNDILQPSIQLKTFLPFPFNDRGPGYICGQLLTNMSDLNVSSTLFAPYTSNPLLPRVKFKQTLSGLLGKAFYRYAPLRSKRATELAFLRSIEASGNDVAYLWGDTSLGFSRALKERGVPVVREKFNCGKAFAKRILDDAYHRLGEPPHHGITDKAVAEEEARLKLVDAVYCPNAMVELSMKELGIPDSARLATSYGFTPERLQTNDRLLDPIDGVTFVFVGTICVRKGAHLLLEAWTRTGIKGRLVLAGGIEPLIEKRCAHLLARPDILRLPYVKNVGALYNSADVFVFPTLEEGGPQVTYEAAFCGLPAIVSPMGAGRMIRAGSEGFVIDPYDIEGWVDAMREIAANSTLREQLAAAARERSLQFTYAVVGSKRRELLENWYRGPVAALKEPQANPM